jgi:hypothetical protein
MRTYELSKILQDRLSEHQNNSLETHRNNKIKIKEYQIRIREDKDLIKILHNNHLISDENFEVLNILF